MIVCPCCNQRVALVRGDVIECHLEPGLVSRGHRSRRAGIWCDASGYNAAQAERWALLSEDKRRELLRANWISTKAVA